MVQSEIWAGNLLWLKKDAVECFFCDIFKPQNQLGAIDFW